MRIPSLFLQFILQELPHFFLPQKDASDWDFSDGPVAKTPGFQCRGPRGSILGQGTRSHMPQLGVHMPELKSADPACCSEDPTQPNN